MPQRGGIRQYIDQYLDGDSAALFHPDATVAAITLLTTSAPPPPAGTTAGIGQFRLPEPALEPHLLLARFHHYRSAEYRIEPSQQPLTDIETGNAVVLFAAVGRTWPGAIPRPLRDVVGELADTPADLWLGYASMLYELGRRHSVEPLEARGIDWLRHISRISPPDPETSADAHERLGAALYTRYFRTGDTSDLDESIAHSSLSATLHRNGTLRQAVSYGHVSQAVRARYERLGRPADILAAVDAGRSSIEACPPDSSQRPILLGWLGTALWIKFQRSADPGDLTEGVALLRRAVATITASHPDRPTHQNNLGCGLMRQFEAGADDTILDEAIEQLRASTALPHPLRAMYLANLGAALHRRYRSVSPPRRADFDEAINTLERALALAKPTDSAYEAISFNLSLARASAPDHG